MLQRIMATTDDKAVALARLALGVVVFAHGAQKVLGWWGGPGFSGTLEAFAGMGMPAAITILVMAGEFLGGLGLLAGCLGRIAAAGFGIEMVGAVLLVHRANGFFMNWFGNQQGEGYEYHILALGLCLLVVLRGSGAWSLDGALQPEA